VVLSRQQVETSTQAEVGGGHGPRDSFVFDMHSPPALSRDQQENQERDVAAKRPATIAASKSCQSCVTPACQSHQGGQADGQLSAEKSMPGTPDSVLPFPAAGLSTASPAVPLPADTIGSSGRRQVVESLERALATLERDIAKRRNRQTPRSWHAAVASEKPDTTSTSIDSLTALEAEIAAQHRRLQEIGHQSPDKQGEQGGVTLVRGTDMRSNASSGDPSSVATVRSHAETSAVHRGGQTARRWQVEHHADGWTAQLAASSIDTEDDVSSPSSHKLTGSAIPSTVQDSFYGTETSSLADSLRNSRISV
jgi:hypothetical protein